jgi:rhodanese-related sulfurtransferase
VRVAEDMGRAPIGEREEGRKLPVVAEETATEIQISPDRAAELIEAGAFLVDVRRPYEWDAGRIPGATHIEMNDLASSAESVPRDRPVVFYCRSGSRSALAAAAFRQAGWDAYNLESGVQDWVDQGHELDPPDGEVAPPKPGS